MTDVLSVSRRNDLNLKCAQNHAIIKGSFVYVNKVFATNEC